MTAVRTNLPFAIQSEETSPAQTGHSEPVGCCTAAFRKAVVCVSCSNSASGMTAVRDKTAVRCRYPTAETSRINLLSWKGGGFVTQLPQVGNDMRTFVTVLYGRRAERAAGKKHPRSRNEVRRPRYKSVERLISPCTPTPDERGGITDACHNSELNCSSTTFQESVF